ncbi:MAG: SAM-dependent methyltransferase [Candidatus Omnitrophota bacterium]
MNLLITCKKNYENILTREAALNNINLKYRGLGYIFAASQLKTLKPEFCFAELILKDPDEISADSVNALTVKLSGLFTGYIKNKNIKLSLPFIFASSPEDKLNLRVKTVKKAWFKKISKKVSRVSKLLNGSLTLGNSFQEGFFVYFAGFNKAFVSFFACSQKQPRMQMDPLAPSRSYLKVEEAYHVLGCQPRINETVIDLGAAIGGWSYSALKRKAKVIAIDNASLKEPVRSHPNLTHLKEDALKFKPDKNKSADWLFCDIIENPEIILKLLNTWLKNAWCRKFIVNLKIGRSDPIALISKIKDEKTGLTPYCSALKIRQLYHDREEITLIGKHISFSE